MRKFVINVFLLIVTIGLPLSIFDKYQEDSRIIVSIQVSVFLLVFIGSALLTYLNNKNRKEDKEHKGWWIAFQTFGIFGICYSGYVLTLLYLFRNLGQM